MNANEQPLTFYKLNCGFRFGIQRLNPHQFCAYSDRETARNPQLNL